MQRAYPSPLHADVASTLRAAIRAAGYSVTSWARAHGISYTLVWQWTRGLCVPRRARDIAAVVAVTGIDAARFQAYDRVAAQPPWGTGRRLPSLRNHENRGGDRPLRVEHRPDCPADLRCRCFLGADDIALMDEIDALAAG